MRGRYKGLLIICQGLIRSDYASVKRNHRCFSVSYSAHSFYKSRFFTQNTRLFLYRTQTAQLFPPKQNSQVGKIAPFSHSGELIRLVYTKYSTIHGRTEPMKGFFFECSTRHRMSPSNPLLFCILNKPYACFRRRSLHEPNLIP